MKSKRKRIILAYTLLIYTVVFLGCSGIDGDTGVEVKEPSKHHHTSTTEDNTDCCKYCGDNSKACGDTCISNDKTCHTTGGCACEGEAP